MDWIEFKIGFWLQHRQTWKAFFRLFQPLFRRLKKKHFLPNFDINCLHVTGFFVYFAMSTSMDSPLFFPCSFTIFLQLYQGDFHRFDEVARYIFDSTRPRKYKHRAQASKFGVLLLEGMLMRRNTPRACGEKTSNFAATVWKLLFKSKYS